jgi:lysine 2,3-aminomutase
MYKTKDSYDSTDWNNWKFQLKNSIRNAEQMAEWVNLTDHEKEAIDAVKDKYRWIVTPYYASIMNPENENCPVRLQSLPHINEMKTIISSDVDPVGDTINLKTRRVVHKYPNRIVFLVSDTCPVYCRHCTRKFHTTDLTGTYYDKEKSVSYEEDFAYIEQHPEINDVLLTGGDPLTLTDKALETIISRLRSIPHINIIRIGSRYPVFLPQRITEELCSMLEKYHPVWLSTHFNHPNEITEESAAACDRLLRHGIPVQNQSVLLKGINDDLETMRKLIRGLLGIRVRPYYLYHCDNVTGVSHFSTSIEKGLEIMDGLLGFETGFSVPTYVITTKLGKIPIQRPYVIQEDGRTYVTNYKKQRMDITEYLNIDL